ncbi:hypothetical protein [Prochlorococcus marinus]|uniref:hypothetical protein n=1 Tax=Prochlorococcus TaxID=1218 RepID=UPI0012DA06BB|nr:hypothetical protein [Prochlorococcus marinus]
MAVVVDLEKPSFLARRRSTKAYSSVIRNTLVNRSSAEVFFIEPLAVRLTSCWFSRER